ncbi:Rha family transcriptional regulator [Rhizobium sp. S96]|uniref:Rha family transcriptional regulator n=1 Tax=Rhizobium sp. S96 TaxID=3055140 RepID=UPI0025AAC214|nr:Rha family transcriptional regulator [Rhizobium sp. S96]MDM9622706.1 Rha family transcriptional regulator [Rhizobium sp. S96]
MLHIKDGAVYANSRDVAKYFEKRHDNVLRDIDELLQHSSDLSGVYFSTNSKPHPLIKGRMDRTFEMTRDGFSLLAMGFTGPKALRFKIAYIEAYSFGQRLSPLRRS